MVIAELPTARRLARSEYVHQASGSVDDPIDACLALERNLDRLQVHLENASLLEFEDSYPRLKRSARKDQVEAEKQLESPPLPLVRGIRSLARPLADWIEVHWKPEVAKRLRARFRKLEETCTEHSRLWHMCLRCDATPDDRHALRRARDEYADALQRATDYLSEIRSKLEGWRRSVEDACTSPARGESSTVASSAPNTTMTTSAADHTGRTNRPVGRDEEPPQMTSERRTSTDRPNERGEVASPADPKAYAGVVEIVNNHTPPTLAIEIRHVARIVEDYAANNVRWTRPRTRGGNPDCHRRSVHLGDWAAYIKRRSGADADGFPRMSESEIEERKAQVRLARPRAK